MSFIIKSKFIIIFILAVFVLLEARSMEPSSLMMEESGKSGVGIRRWMRKVDENGLSEECTQGDVISCEKLGAAYYMQERYEDAVDIFSKECVKYESKLSCFFSGTILYDELYNRVEAKKYAKKACEFKMKQGCELYNEILAGH